MKFDKFIPKFIITTIFLGTIFIAAFSNTNASVSADDIHKVVTNNGDNINANSGPNITTGTQADINQGLLSLESVPNLNFGNNNSSSVSDSDLKLTSNDVDSNNTGNVGSNGNLLKVADYRNINSGTKEGWTLNASLGSVNNADNDTYDKSSYSQQNDWKINMSHLQNINYYANNYDRYGSDGKKDTSSDNTAPNIHDATLQSGNSNSGDIIGTDNNYSRGHGLTSINYTGSNTTLSTPYNVQPGKYTTSITWNLSANPDENSNQPT